MSTTVDKNKEAKTFLIPLKDAEQAIGQGLSKNKMTVSSESQLISKYPNLSGYVPTQGTQKVSSKTVTSKTATTKAADTKYVNTKVIDGVTYGQDAAGKWYKTE